MMDQREFLSFRSKSCKDRGFVELSEGIRFLGKRAVRSTELSWLLTDSGGELAHGTRARETVIAAMLTWERSLVEFVLAPVRKFNVGADPSYTLATDYLKQNLCPWCFGIAWRLQDDDSKLHRLISKRWESISRHPPMPHGKRPAYLASST